MSGPLEDSIDPSAATTKQAIQTNTLDGGTLARLADRYGTPLYVYDGRELAAAVARLRWAVEPFARVLYSVKANPHPEILAAMHRLGCGAEVASRGELSAALRQGFPAMDVAFAGPGKTDDDLAAAVHCGVMAVNVESPGEVERLAEFCGREGAYAKVAFRLAAEALVDKGADRRFRRGYWMGSQPFGMDLGAFEGAIAYVRGHPRLHAVGIHCHLASGILDGSAMAWSVENIVTRALPLARRFGLCWINVGGGLGIPVYEDDHPLDLSALRDSIRSLADRYPVIAAGEVRLAVESGRYLVGTCGYYVCRVVDVKVNQGRKFVILDGGIHQDLFQSSVFRHVGRPTGLTVCQPAVAMTSPAEVVGPLCTPIDRLGSRVELPDNLAPGCVVSFRNAGAYAKYASPLNFLGHDWPAEVLVNGSGVRLISRRISLAEVMNLQITSAQRAGGTCDLEPE